MVRAASLLRVLHRCGFYAVAKDVGVCIVRNVRGCSWMPPSKPITRGLAPKVSPRSAGHKAMLGPLSDRAICRQQESYAFP